MSGWGSTDTADAQNVGIAFAGLRARVPRLGIPAQRTAFNDTLGHLRSTLDSLLRRGGGDPGLREKYDEASTLLQKAREDVAAGRLEAINTNETLDELEVKIIDLVRARNIGGRRRRRQRGGRMVQYKEYLQDLRKAVNAGVIMSSDEINIVDMVEYALEENSPEDKAALDAMLALAQDASKSDAEKVSGVDALLRPIEMRLGLIAPTTREPNKETPSELGGRRRRKTRKGRSTMRRGTRRRR